MKCFVPFLVAAALLVGASAASAAITVQVDLHTSAVSNTPIHNSGGTDYYSSSSYQKYPGGEFWCTIIGDYTLPDGVTLGTYSEPNDTGIYDASSFELTGFATFCIDGAEYFYPGNPYTFEVQPTILASGDSIKRGTEVLYAAFAGGTLDDYNYENLLSFAQSRQDDAGELQNAFWALQGKTGYTASTDNKFIQWAIDNSEATNVDDLLGEGTGTVAYALAKSGVQDQLILVNVPPSPTPVVPEPGSMAIWGTLMGLGIAGGRYRKRRVVA